MDPLAAVADPTRRRIIELLGRGERCGPAISQHLKALREAGLVRVRSDAQRRIYALDPAGLEAIDAWLASVRRFWSPRLDALERELRKNTRRKR
jgi:DNA-binding transcriptional ArsR family regulator